MKDESAIVKPVLLLDQRLFQDVLALFVLLVLVVRGDLGKGGITYFQPTG